MRCTAILSFTFLFILATQTSAQSATSLSAGATLVYGPASIRAARGFHVQVGEEFGHWGGHLRFRVDALYSQSPGYGLTRSRIERTYGLATGSIVRGPRLRFVSPYALVGVGLYGSDSYTMYAPGVNAGGGIELFRGSKSIYAEARVHQFWRDSHNSPIQGRGATLVPLSFGFRF
jgi:hypothetical protein